ncbi:copper amine oxidase N-terminal domain-containing protein [Paenibacillus sp. NPDC058071]|uniref:copper amine oxidase N-terminal domain-containing protein n=1 Tax=Paenibacillus sp. NPDC058071 TaxID=3346326 RepID=UPI0036DD784C
MFKQARLKNILTLVLTVLLVFSLLPGAVLAAQQNTGSEVTVQLWPNNSKAIINGENVTIQAPVELNGTTFVPLSVITKAFGAALSRKGDSIVLTYNDRTVTVTIGSKTVLVNGSKTTVSLPPFIVKGTTMVPARVISEAFGATIQQDRKSKSIFIKGQRASSTGSVSANGAKVGDSYWGWSLSEPAGLAISTQSQDGSYVNWSGSNGNTSELMVYSYKDVGSLTNDDIFDYMQELFEDDETTLERRSANRDGMRVEIAITRTTDDPTVYEYRGFSKGNDYYLILLGVKGKDKSGLSFYQPLLSSFQPSFDRSNGKLKDITKVKDGTIEFGDDYYGLTMRLPLDWVRDEESYSPQFYSDNGFFNMEIYTLQNGDTAEKWREQRQKLFRQNFAQGYYKNENKSEIDLWAGKALVYSFDFSYDLETWYRANEIYWIKGNNKYFFTYNYDVKTGAQGEALFRKTMASLKVDTALIENEFEAYDDYTDQIDYDAKTTKTSSAFRYSLELPTYWTAEEDDFESEQFYYSYDYFSLYGSVERKTTLKEASDAYYEASKNDAEYKNVTRTAVPIGGKDGVRIMLQFTSGSGLPTTEYTYLTEHNGNVLQLMFTIYDANATPETLKRLEAVVQSIKFQ